MVIIYLNFKLKQLYVKVHQVCLLDLCCFDTCLSPSITNLLSNNRNSNLCVFLYGHVASGKNQTLYGITTTNNNDNTAENNDDDTNANADNTSNTNDIGLIESSAKLIFNKLNELNSGINDENKNIFIEIRFTELFQNKLQIRFVQRYLKKM